MFRAECINGMMYTMAGMGCVQQYDMAIAYYSPQLVGLDLNDYTETGGAHPNTSSTPLNLQITKESFGTVDFSTVFKYDQQDAVSRIVYAKLRKLKQARDPELVRGMPVNGKLDEDISNRFLLLPAGAVFYISGSFAEGDYYVLVPYPELAGVLNVANPDLPAFISAVVGTVP